MRAIGSLRLPPGRLPAVVPLLLLLSPRAVLLVSGSKSHHEPHDPSVAPMIEWFTSRGLYYNPKQVVRRAVPGDESTMLGVFATDLIEEGELLCSVPWNNTINAGRRVDDPTHLICDTVHNLVREMRLGDESDFAPYVKYLLEQRVGQLPSAWSDAGKDLLRKVLDGDALPPEEATDLIEDDWYRDCGGARDPFQENAAMLVIQRAEDDLMLPVYDFYNHRNGKYLNTLNKRINKARGQVKFKVYAAKDIPAGEQIYISYNMCANCGGRADSYGTAEMFQDYGFVEPMPQRWIFPEEGFKFDLSEKEDGSGELEVSWMRGGRPTREPRRKHGVGNFHRHIQRLERLKHMEHLNRNEEVSDYEWDAVWQYCDALVNAMKHAIMANHHEDDDGKAGGGAGSTCAYGSCPASIDAYALSDDAYDDLDYEDDELFYDEAPYEYTLSCDSEKFLQFEGYEVFEEFDTLFQSVQFFYMPDGDRCLEMDDVVQTCAGFRPHYHELVLDYPARYIDSLKRVLFVGGGDSMLLWEALKYPDIELVVGLELEQQVTRKAFKYFYTQPHFHDERVEWWFGDAIKSLRLLPEEYFGSFDLVLVDLSETVASFSVSSRLNMLEALALLVKPEGIMVKNEWVYLDKLSSIFQYTARVQLHDVPYTCDQAMTMGSNKIDFLNRPPKDHRVKRLLLGPSVDGDRRFYDTVRFHDYQKNEVKAHASCNGTDIATGKESIEDEKREGVLMIINAEDTTVPLKPFGPIEEVIRGALEKEGLTVLSAVSSPSGEDGEAVVIFIKEGYISARTWPGLKYCAFDIHLWAKFNKQGTIEDLLLRSVGTSTNEGSRSAYRIVAGGMHGTESWEEDKYTIGPHIALTRLCHEAPAADAPEKDSLGDPAAVDAVLEEGLGLVQNRENIYLVICGVEDEPCRGHDVISRSVGEGEVVVLWTCPEVVGDDEPFAQDSADRMGGCEKKTMSLLEKHGKIGAVVIDDGAPLAMIKILLSILSSDLNRDKMLANQAIFMTLMDSRSETWHPKHNFLDRIRKLIGYHPVFKAELVLSGADDGRMEMGVMSAEDPLFIPRLYNLTKELEAKPGLDVEVRKFSGGVWRWQDRYNPRYYFPHHFDPLPAKEQFAAQRPAGRQSIFQLEPETEEDEVSRGEVQSALFFALSKNEILVDELKTIAVGDGFVVAALSPGDSAIVVFDGSGHIDINLFSYDESQERSHRFIDTFARMVPFKLVQRDEQPRGTGRVINFREDIDKYVMHVKDPSNDTEDDMEDAEDNSNDAEDAADEKALYQCPSTELGTGMNDIAGYFNYYDKDNARHFKRSKEDGDYFTEGYRHISFGGRGQTFSELKEMATKYKARAYGDNLRSGDTIYEGACGEGFNLLLTLQILREQRGIENLTAYGSDYLAASTTVANNLFDAQASEHGWIRKGLFCQGDSTQLDFVPSDTFDLAFTYVDPLVDPLRRHGEDVPFEKRVEISRDMCTSDSVLVQKEQAAQEEWHSSWVKELVRIVKPGKAVIIEDVDTPICDETSDWGGVSVDWWKDAVSKYNWDVDPDSIEIDLFAWYENRYNVLMRKNDVQPKISTSSDSTTHGHRHLSLTLRNDTAAEKCPRRFWNSEMNVYNVMEIDVDRDIVREIWNDYETDVRPHLNSGKSTDDFCLVTPYNPETNTWENDDGIIRSDIKWFSVRNEKTYKKYLRHVDRLGVKDKVKGTWINADEITVYAMFFIPRSFSKTYHFHIDWHDECHTQVMTMLVPVNDFDIHLRYKDVDDEERDYEYKVGKAIAFGGGFMHSTGIGQGEEEDVLLCIYLGTDDPKIWEYAQDNIADELEYYMSPINGFTRNEMYPDKSICQ